MLQVWRQDSPTLDKVINGASNPKSLQVQMTKEKYDGREAMKGTGERNVGKQLNNTMS